MPFIVCNNPDIGTGATVMANQAVTCGSRILGTANLTFSGGGRRGEELCKMTSSFCLSYCSCRGHQLAVMQHMMQQLNKLQFCRYSRILCYCQEAFRNLATLDLQRGLLLLPPNEHQVACGLKYNS